MSRYETLKARFFRKITGCSFLVRCRVLSLIIKGIGYHY
jgi:hypothetical protein